MNSTMGCDGCEIWSSEIKTWYAGSLHTRFGGVTQGHAPGSAELTPFPGRMAQAAGWSDLSGKFRRDRPWLNGMPRQTFRSDLSYAMSKFVTFEFLLNEVIANATSEAGMRHHWHWLTKRPERMANFSSWLRGLGTTWPENLWAGTSVTTQLTISRIDSLRKVHNGMLPQVPIFGPSLVPHRPGVLKDYRGC